jgi:hypothetical protein
MELPNAIFQMLFFLKDVTAGGSNRNLAVIPIPIFLFQLKLSEIILNSNCPTNPNYFGAIQL